MTNSETERPDFNDGYRQGDIIRIERTASGQPSLGVIINADCDLENKKIDGVIAYLPIFKFSEYFEEFYLEGYFDETVKSISTRLSQELELKEKDLPDLLRWISADDADAIVTKICSERNTSEKNRAALKKSVAQVKHCLDLLSDRMKKFTLLCTLENEPLSYAKKHISAARKAMGEGHFFVSEIVGEEDIGFVVRMRRIYTIEAQNCYRSVAGQISGSDGSEQTAVRTARLTPLYAFKVAQLFAQQYSRVGLPNEIMELGSLAIDDLVTRISEGL